MTVGDDLEELMTTALAHHEAGDIEAAARLYRAVLRIDPDEADALNLLGLVLQNQGQIAEGVELISRAVRLVPDFAEAWTNLARGQHALGHLVEAEQSARAAVALDPSVAEAQFQLGCILAENGRDQAAAQAFRRAVALDPTALDARQRLGAVQLRLGEYQAAADQCRDVLASDPGRVDAMINLGLALVGTGRIAEALQWHAKAAASGQNAEAACAALAVTRRLAQDPGGSAEACQQALQYAPHRVDMWLLRGSNLASLGRFAEAADAFRQALVLDPNATEARRELALIGQHSNDEALVQNLQATLSDPSAEDAKRISAGFALGRTLDQRGERDAAFAALATANALVRARLTAAGKTYDDAANASYVDWAMRTFQPAMFGATAGGGDLSDLPVFIVGMPRSGTTLVEQIAASHPAVFGAGERRDIQDLVVRLQGGATYQSPAVWDRARMRQIARSHVDTLRNLGAGAIRVTDKLPDNAFLLGQIAVLFPNARVIICRRDPRDVGLSCYFQHFGDDITWACDQQSIAARIRQYNRLMAHWRAVLPIRFIEVAYETLIQDLEAESRRLIDFLGLEWDPACLDFHKTDRPVMTASFFQVRQPLYDSSVGRWREYQDHLAPMLGELADAPQSGAASGRA